VLLVLTAALARPAAIRAAPELPTPTGGARVCLVPFTAAVREGPSAGQGWSGVIGLRQERSGAIDHGALFVVAGERDGAIVPGPTLPVVGQATGRAINLLITLADGRAVFGVGTMAADLAHCGGIDLRTGKATPFFMGGPLVGPEPGDLGDWATTGDTGALTTPSAISWLVASCRDANLFS
jgi:hypothetical protein